MNTAAKWGNSPSPLVRKILTQSLPLWEGEADCAEGVELPKLTLATAELSLAFLPGHPYVTNLEQPVPQPQTGELIAFLERVARYASHSPKDMQGFRACVGGVDSLMKPLALDPDWKQVSAVKEHRLRRAATPCEDASPWRDGPDFNPEIVFILARKGGLIDTLKFQCNTARNLLALATRDTRLVDMLNQPEKNADRLAVWYFLRTRLHCWAQFRLASVSAIFDCVASSARTRDGYGHDSSTGPTLPRRATLAARLPELAELVDQLESFVARAA